MMWSTKAADIDTDAKVTRYHRAVTQEDEWLNTSRALTAEDLASRIILLDFWTFCCINCIHVIPDLHYLEEKFGKDLTVIGVHSAKFVNERDSENIRAAMLRYEIEHPVVNDARFMIWESFGVRAWPSFVLINPEGKIEEMYSGEGNREQQEKDIAALIEKYKGKFNNSPLPIELEKDKVPKTILNFPGKLEVQDNKDEPPVFYIADSNNDRILHVSEDGMILTQIGSGEEGFKDGSFEEAQFNKPQGLLYDYNNSALYVADTNNHALRKIDFQAGQVTTLAGTGKQGFDRMVINQSALEAHLASPWDLAFYPDDKHITIAMAGTHQLWTYGLEDKEISVRAGNGREYIDDGVYPFNSLSQPSGMSVHDGKLYFVDSETSSLRVLEGRTLTTLIGTGLFDFGFKDGQHDEALMQHPLGIHTDDSGVYITDSYNHAIRKYDPAAGELTTIAGKNVRGTKNGVALGSRFNEPNDIVRIGDKFYIADTNNHQIRILDIKSDKVSVLPIVPQSNSMAEVVEALPNLGEDEVPQVMAGKEISFNLDLQKGWKINDLAPSWLALFEKTGAGYNAVAQFDQAKLKEKTVKLPALEEGKTYRLQGTLYYCEDKEGALCLIQSYDQTFSPDEGEDSISVVLE